MRQRFDSVDGIRQSGFDGFIPIATLQLSKCCDVSDKPGVYFVLRTSAAPPEFLDKSTGGPFKGRNPTVRISRLESKWVRDALVLYIGKAGPGKRCTLRSRLKQYMQFGQGDPVGHWGGRYIWQLRHSGKLLLCWKVISDIDPRSVERDLIRRFEEVYHNMPFANCQR